MKKTLLLLFIVVTTIAFAEETRKEKLKLIKEHNRAVHIKGGWIRDPYITIGPDGYYYLTGTTPNPNDPREQSDPYNVGLNNVPEGVESIVGSVVQMWRSENLVDWEDLGVIYDVNDSKKANNLTNSSHKNNNALWAPEVHWVGDRWALVHCPKGHSTLALSGGLKFDGEWSHPSPSTFIGRHDPSLFKDDNGEWYLLFGNTSIAKLKPDFRGLITEPVRIDPSDRRIGHEGATMVKVGEKYVHIGTAWSTDAGRRGSYNLYYCTSDNITGPYSERRFLGRFLGHGTPFQDKTGKWWCTAFFNGNVLPLPTAGIQDRDLSETAQTINERGTTIVPLEVKTLPNGDAYLRAIDPNYSNPGPDEGKYTNQKPTGNKSKKGKKGKKKN